MGKSLILKNKKNSPRIFGYILKKKKIKKIKIKLVN